MDNNMILGLIVGFLFGASLYLAGLADPDKIIGTLRLKDFHAMRTILLFVFVGMLGTWVLQQLGYANMSVKPATMVSVTIGGALLGIGFGMTGYCPGTGLACAAAGRLDALVTVAGMLVGAWVYILIYPEIALRIDEILNYGKATLPEITKTNSAMWVFPISGIGIIALILTSGLGPKKQASE